MFAVYAAFLQPLYPMLRARDDLLDTRYAGVSLAFRWRYSIICCSRVTCCCFRLALLSQVDEGDAPAAALRNELLCKLANLCKKQGSFHLATKKYTQVCDHRVL